MSSDPSTSSSSNEAGARKTCFVIMGFGKKVDFESCATQIIEAEQGVKVLQFWFEQNGKYAHVLIEWDDPEQKLNVVFDTQAIEVVDLVKSEDIDRIATTRTDGE